MTAIAKVTDLSIDSISQGLENGDFVLIDVREPHEFAMGHIPGSVSLPLSQFNPVTLAAYAGQRVVFSCAAGVRSAHALHAAQAAGLAFTEHYAGGFKDWLMSGYPIERV